MNDSRRGPAVPPGERGRHVTVRFRPIEPDDQAEWIRMRLSLWPDQSAAHASDTAKFFASQDPDYAVIVAEAGDGSLAGFVEVGSRFYGEGCDSSPVGFIEGWWVDPDQRLRGVGAKLVAQAENWARSRGLTEMASDALLENREGHRAHRAVGFEEVERLVCFRKSL